ncbi:MAG: rhodanese-related sulfurtransferase [Saprospiraceae bacterium]|nr:rhodanese-related sulfurtransferase [Saprospiraceae bacterium]
MRLYNRINGEELKRLMKESNEQRTTLSFYKYHKILNPNFFRDHLYVTLDQVGVLGRIYVANEGINGQISVPSENLDSFRNALNTIDFLQGLRLNIAIEDDGKSFFKLKILVREKIVADGLEDDTFDVTNRGTHVNALQFNELAEDPETILVDMRNHYESEVGHFANAITPDVETFRESLPIISDMLSENKEKKILMYCTGGIRCEKASAYMKHKGFQNVFQLDGGIIEYARQVNEQHLENKFIGKNFVFDERLGERISHEVIAHCHQCGNTCDTHVNCANDACHLLFIQCSDCSGKYEECCSDDCQDFIQIPEEDRVELRKSRVFNGTKFGKNRYKAYRKSEGEALV